MVGGLHHLAVAEVGTMRKYVEFLVLLALVISMYLGAYRLAETDHGYWAAFLGLFTTGAVFGAIPLFVARFDP